MLIETLSEQKLQEDLMWIRNDARKKKKPVKEKNQANATKRE